MLGRLPISTCAEWSTGNVAVLAVRSYSPQVMTFPNTGLPQGVNFTPERGYLGWAPGLAGRCRAMWVSTNSAQS
jgi:hypothetical protein